MSMAFQYQEKKSFMHDVDPITKIVWMMCISVLVFIYETAVPQLGFFVVTLFTAFFFARLSPRFVLHGIWIMLLFSIGFFILQVLFVPGHTLLYSFGPVRIYTESLDFATAITFRILTIFTSSLVFVATSDPRDIVISLTKHLKIPYRYSYSIFVALRFVPTLESEARIIEAAQTIRGVGKQKGLRNKAENLKRFSLPLLMGALRRVRVTANTMEAKGYGAYSDRTYIRTVKISKKGIGFVVLWIAATVLLVAMRLR